jgi:hypothetical protein
MQPFHYDSDINGGSLMVRESRIVAGLLIAGATPEKWDGGIGLNGICGEHQPEC